MRIHIECHPVQTTIDEKEELGIAWRENELGEEDEEEVVDLDGNVSYGEKKMIKNNF